MFASEWQMIQNRMDGNSFTFFIGMNGSGKSYAMLKRCEILGKNVDDTYEFTFDLDHLENHVFFDRQDMQNKVAELEKMKSSKVRGYMLNLDEAQMTANAKQWNDRDILEFSKEMTSIRSSRFSISLNMPSYKMITTDLRQLGTYICEMYPPSRIDRQNRLAFSKLHLLELKPYLGVVWRHRPFISVAERNPVTGLSQSHGGLLSEFSWELPSRELRRNYEKLKKEFRKKSSERKAIIKEDKRTKKNISFTPVPELAKRVMEANLPKLTGGTISAFLGVGRDKAFTIKEYIDSLRG